MKKHRFACLMAVGAYPMLLALLHLLPDSLMLRPHWQKALVIVPMMIAWMLYVVSPFLLRHFGAWLGVAGRD
jgi:hypothetical protein